MWQTIICNKDSKPLTECIKFGIIALVMKGIIFIVSFQHTIPYAKFYFYS